MAGTEHRKQIWGAGRGRRVQVLMRSVSDAWRTAADVKSAAGSMNLGSIPSFKSRGSALVRGVAVNPWSPLLRQGVEDEMPKA